MSAPTPTGSSAPAAAQGGWRRIGKVLWRIFLSLLIVFVLLVVLDLFLLEVPFHLLLGWVMFLRETLPQVRTDAGMIVSGIVALFLATWGLHRFVAWLTSQLPSYSRPWKWQSTLAVTVLILLLFSSALAGIGIGHQVGWLSQIRWTSMRWLDKNRDTRNATLLGVAIRSWAAEHGDVYPEVLDLALVSARFGKSPDPLEILLGRGTDQMPEPWIYFGAGMTSDAPDWLPVVAAPRPSTKDGTRYVHSKGGADDFLTPKEYQELLQKWRAYMRTRPQPEKP